jgi:hypothetical protein
MLRVLCIAFFASALLSATAQAQMSPQKCSELADMITRTKRAVAQAEGASSQQQPIKDALAQYQALYASQCAR